MAPLPGNRCGDHSFPTEDMEYLPLKKIKWPSCLEMIIRFACCESITLKDLDRQPMIICDGGYESPFIDMFKEAGSVLTAAFTVYNVNTSISMIKEGLGIAILSQMSMSGISAPENVVTRELNQAVYRDVLLAVPSIKEASLAAKLFIQIAQELTKNE